MPACKEPAIAPAAYWLQVTRKVLTLDASMLPFPMPWALMNHGLPLLGRLAGEAEGAELDAAGFAVEPAAGAGLAPAGGVPDPGAGADDGGVAGAGAPWNCGKIGRASCRERV